VLWPTKRILNSPGTCRQQQAAAQQRVGHHVCGQPGGGAVVGCVRALRTQSTHLVLEGTVCAIHGSCAWWVGSSSRGRRSNRLHTRAAGTHGGVARNAMQRSNDSAHPGQLPHLWRLLALSPRQSPTSRAWHSRCRWSLWWTPAPLICGGVVWEFWVLLRCLPDACVVNRGWMGSGTAN
jgi:hypothetical protein